MKKIHDECSCPQGAIPFAVCLGFSSDCCPQSFVTTFKRLNNKLRESLHTNRASFAIALGKSVAADLLRFADKSAHQVRSCSSVCFITCEFESRYLHQVKLRMKNSWLFIFVKFERAVPPGPKRHTVQQMISTNRNCSLWSNRSWEISCS